MRFYAFTLIARGTHVVSDCTLKRSNQAASDIADVPLPTTIPLAKAGPVAALIERQIRVVHQPPGMPGARRGTGMAARSTARADHQHSASRRVVSRLGGDAAMLAGVHHQLSLELLEPEEDEESQELLEDDQSLPLLLELLEHSWCRWSVSCEEAARVAM